MLLPSSVSSTLSPFTSSTPTSTPSSVSTPLTSLWTNQGLMQQSCITVDVVKYGEWSTVNMNYFAYTQTISLTLFGILAGFLVAYLRRYKYTLVFGTCLRLLGVGRESLAY